MAINMTSEQCELILGNCLEKMKELPDESVDLCLTDPPYGLEFMGKEWDRFSTEGKNFYEKWTNEWASIVLPKLKAGAFLVFTMSPRQDLLWRCLAGLEKVGFALGFSSMFWLYHTGFPKAMDVSKAIDKRPKRLELNQKIGKIIREHRLKKKLNLRQLGDLCNEPLYKIGGTVFFETESTNRLPTKEQWIKLKEVLEISDEYDVLFEEAEREIVGIDRQKGNIGYENENYNYEPKERILTKSNTMAGKYWSGWKSFSLKPAVECIVVAQKPRKEKTIVGQVLATGTGACNVEACRIPFSSDVDVEKSKHNWKPDSDYDGNKSVYELGTKKVNTIQQGTDRFPANLIVSGEPLKGESSSGALLKKHNALDMGKGAGYPCYGTFKGEGKISQNYKANSGSTNRFYSLDAWAKKRSITLCEDSAFFDVPKPSKAEKDKGLEGIEEKKQRMQGANAHNCFEMEGAGRKTNTLNKNNHPTCKPVTLFAYLAELFCQPNGLVLDPFMGSGTTGIAALKVSKRFIGIEKDEEYFKIAEARLKPLKEQVRLKDV